MKEIILFVVSVLLFIALIPGTIFKPYKFKLLGKILHGVLFTVFYAVIRMNIEPVQENMEQKNEQESEKENEDKYESLQQQLQQQMEQLEKSNTSDQSNAESMVNFFESKTKNWSNDDMKILETKYDSKKEMYDEDVTDKFALALNTADIELVREIDKLSSSEQDALIKVFQNMNHDEIQKLADLNLDQLKEMLNEMNK